MARNVFILGAGASREAGGPLMYDFLDMAESLYLYSLKRARDPLEGDFEVVFKAISDLQLVYSKSHLDSYNIETLFGIIEMGMLIEKFSNYSITEIRKLRSSIINVIVRTLESSINFPIDNKFLTISAPAPYKKFAELLSQTNYNNSIITFNYDMAIDYALYRAGAIVDYCLDENNTKGFKLLKLHGSANWDECKNPNCKKILPLYLHEFYGRNIPKVHDDELKFIQIPFSSFLNRIPHHKCDNPLTYNTPLLIPPTWNKTDYHWGLSKVWNQAAQELFEAVNIVVIGYSLPETDSFFKYLYALGTMGPTRIKNFVVIDIDKEGVVEKRFRDLIGKGIERRFQLIRKSFGTAINENIILDILKG